MLTVALSTLISRSTTHTKVAKKQHWQVNLGKKYHINLVIVYNRIDAGPERINGAIVWAGKTKCGTIYYKKGRSTYPIACNGVAASTVKVSHNNFLHMAEVQVYGGALAVKSLNLLSLHQKTAQSSMGWGGVSTRAVDGNPSAYYAHKSVSHTKYNKDNWWTVDLGATYPVYLVLIHNRALAPQRINGAKVFLDKYQCGTVQYHPSRKTYAINCGGKQGKVVKITLAAEYLQMAEVQVYGVGTAFGGDGGIWAHHTGGWKITSIKYKKPMKLPGGSIKLGNVFVIKGRHKSATKGWVFNFVGGKGEIALHFNGRPKKKVIVLNSFRGGKWEKEIRFPWPDVKVGQSMIILVTVGPKGYTFQFNNDHIKGVLFPHRIPFDRVRSVKFNGPAGTWTSISRSKL